MRKMSMQNTMKPLKTNLPLARYKCSYHSCVCRGFCSSMLQAACCLSCSGMGGPPQPVSCCSLLLRLPTGRTALAGSRTGDTRHLNLEIIYIFPETFHHDSAAEQ